MHARTSSGEEQWQERNVVLSCWVAKDAVQQKPPGVQVTHVHQGTEGGDAGNRVRMCPSGDAGKLDCNGIKAMRGLFHHVLQPLASQALKISRTEMKEAKGLTVASDNALMDWIIVSTVRSLGFQTCQWNRHTLEGGTLLAQRVDWG
jgi:hypothetical protein